MNRLSRNILLPLAFAVTLALGGCNERPSATTPVSSVTVSQGDAARSADAVYAAAEETPVHGAGELVGQVWLRGSVPALPRLDVTGSICGQAHAGGIPDESVVATPDGRLANVLVHLRGAPASDAAGSAVLHQVNCRYEPHVVALQVGQSLRITSADAVLHNVHGMANLNPAFNLAQTAAGTTAQLDPFKTAETFPVRCDVHPWMKAWIGVFPDPYFAVSQANGEFHIRGIPPGTYTLVAWHERLGELSRQVTIVGDKPVSATFEYAKP